MSHDKPTAFWRFRPNAPLPGHVLGEADAIAEGSAQEYVIGIGRSAFRMFVVRHKGQFYAYLNFCPHYSLPLNHQPDQFLREGYIECAQHFARFTIDGGLCVTGACEGEHLISIPVAINAEGILIIT